MPGTIVSTRELARTFENEVGAVGGTAKRRWVCNLSDNTLTNGGPPDITTIMTATAGNTWGAAHPAHTALRLRKISVNERLDDNPYALEVTAEYSVVTSSELLRPTLRPSTWAFESRPGSVPALAYYNQNTTWPPDAPLTNSAYDYFPGLTTEESLVQIKVTKNFATYPSLWLSLQNHVNSSQFLGCEQDTVKVVGIDASSVTEEFGNALVSYYATTATLAYRQSGHNLLLPDVGFNFIEGGEKRRAMVFDFKNSEWVASPNPVGLDGFGRQTLGAPAILTRRVNPRASFATFGTP
jgi:hypothetical protein